MNAKQFAHAVDAGGGKLSPAQAKVIFLRFAKRMTEPQIAKRLKISPAAVRNMIHRARRTLPGLAKAFPAQNRGNCGRSDAL
jgi:DNA-directed RNA polymerase specialized sigma24 family protein